MRRLICILLLLCLPLQSFAVQGGALLLGSIGAHRIGHALDHAAEVEHHHEDDGSVHYDDSAESAQHIDDHPSSTQVAHLTARLQPGLPQRPASAVAAAHPCFIPDPVPDNPLRPPAPAPGFAAGGTLHS